MSRESGELIPVPNKPTTDKATDTPKASPATAAASTSTSTPTPAARNPLAIQLVSFFFDNIQRVFKVPTSVDLTHRGYEVTFSTESIAWAKLAAAVAADADEDENRREYEIMPAPANAALHRYIKDLAHVRMELAALLEGEEDDAAAKKLEMRVGEEQEVATSWMKRVCEAAGELGIADPAFCPRK